MATQKTSGGFDFEALRQAEEQRDLDAMLDLYADAAEMRIVNHATPPSAPQVRHKCCGARRRSPRV